MNSPTTRENLLRLRDLILQERECAKVMDMAGMVQAMNAKDQLLNSLANISELSDEDKPLAAEIRSKIEEMLFFSNPPLAG